MNHKNLKVIREMYPDEIVQVELIAENSLEEEDILIVGSITQNYLTIELLALDVIESSGARIIIRKAKDNLGWGS